MHHTATQPVIVYPREIRSFRTELAARRRSRYRRNVTIVHLDDRWWVVPNELGAHHLAAAARRCEDRTRTLTGLYGRARRALTAARTEVTAS